MRAILLFTMLLLVVLPGCASLGNPELADIRTHAEFSQGLRIHNSLYFLHHYALYRPGRVIIPMFAVTNPTVFSQVLTLYRAEFAADGQVQQLEQLAQHLFRNRWLNTNTARYSRGSIADGQIVFEYPDGWDSQTESTVYANIAAPYREEQASATPPAYEEIPFFSVWEQVGGLDFRRWGLPTALDYTDSNIRDMRRLIASGEGDRYAVMAAIRELDRLQEYAALSRAAEVLYRRLQSRSPDSSGAAGTESRLVHTVMTTTLLRRADLSEGADLPYPLPGRLQRAAYQNDISLLQEFIAAGADPTATGELGIPAVTCAVLGDNPRALQILAEAGADLATPSNYGTPPWFIAADRPIRRPFLRLQGVMD